MLFLICLYFCCFDFFDIFVFSLPCQYGWRDVVVDHVWVFCLPFQNSCLYYEVVWLVWPIVSPHLPVTLYDLLVHVEELLEMSFANVALHWLFSGFSMATHTPIKWCDALNNHLRVWLLMGSFQGPIWEPICPKSGIKIWRSTCGRDLLSTLFRVQYGNRYAEKVMWGLGDLLAYVASY